MTDCEEENMVGVTTGNISCARCGKNHIFVADYKEAFFLKGSVYVRCSVNQGPGKCNFWFDRVMSPEDYRINAKKTGVSSALVQKVLEGPSF
ncbi:MAG TPA: hypothetical protein PKY08_03540 [Candidatus Magasanikbacteria bacterium]|nr:hypothetical protein [Candidatus Magasanikbacteria bacterium]